MFRIANQLRSDNERLETLLTIVDNEAAGLKKGRAVDFGLLQQVFEYLTCYTRRYHRPKEDLLMRALLVRDCASRVALLQVVHKRQLVDKEGEKLVRATQLAGNDFVVERAGFERRLMRYAPVVRDYLDDRERYLLEPASRLLCPQEWHALETASKAQGRAMMDALIARQYHALYEHIVEQSGEAQVA